MTAKKIFIIHPYSITASEIAFFCAQAFGELGLRTETCLFHPRHYSSRLGGKIFGSLEYGIGKGRLFFRIREFAPDLVLVIKGEELLPKTVAEIKRAFRVPVANWWIDDPGCINLSGAVSPAYDLFFTNDPDSVAVHLSRGCRFVRFLTFACSPAVHRAVELTKTEADKYACDIIFAGLLTPYRVKVLEQLRDLKIRIWSPPVVQEYIPGQNRAEQKNIPSDSPIYPMLTGSGIWGEELVKAYNAAKIILNIHSHGKSDTNMRVFEATGCGGFLLTEDRRFLKDVFVIGKELVCFKNADELKELARYYLKNESERKAIAAAGQKRVYRDHTYVHRMKEMLAYLEEYGSAKRKMF